ncbi:nitrogen regulation protein NR(II) [uncultured Psychrobacter sp.]|uniref:two-component system sensor histidine kinase NtrB n=1 Tax=uncultured Psychrobacter sp. TaxID=259303 RepID=UPI00345A6DBC
MTDPASFVVRPDPAFMAQHLFTAILWVDNELIIKWLNPQAEQLLAISHKRLLNQSILLLLSADKSDAASYDKDSTIKSNNDAHRACSLTERFRQAQHYQQPFVDHDCAISLEPAAIDNSKTIVIDYSVTPVTYEQQPFFIIEMWGKNRQSRISEEQRQQRQYEVARQMLRSVAHEVKNPLAGIRGAAQLLQRQFNKAYQSNKAYNYQSVPLKDKNDDDLGVRTLSQKLLSYTDIITSETDRLTQLIDQFLGNNQLPNWQMLNIHEPLEHVLTLMHSQYPEVILQRDYDLSLPELSADKDQLIQVFLNLLNNACESMTEYLQDQQSDYRPMLHIQTRIAFRHTIGSQQHKQVLQISVTDNGGGIEAALIGQIFFPMVTHRANGTGLGLSIVQDIISRHHGMIEVSSQQAPSDNQTCFTVYLPFTQSTFAV